MGTSHTVRVNLAFMQDHLELSATTGISREIDGHEAVFRVYGQRTARQVIFTDGKNFHVVIESDGRGPSVAYILRGPQKDFKQYFRT